MSRFFLTTPLYYVNARPHLGHAYSTIVADTVVRFRQQLGENASFLTGTDEHGQKIQRAAEAAGITPQQFADANAARFREEWDRLGLRYSYFIRTSEARHAAAVAAVFRRMQANGHIYKGEYSGAYCVHDELYVEGQPGDVCPTCGRPTEKLTEENYYFRLSAFQQPLLKLYEEQPEFIRPESRRNEVLAFVQAGLRDLSISRTSIRWGIPVPGDEKHVFYVWLDALCGYLTGIGYGSELPADRQRFQDLWPAWHLVGKEIVRFHAVYWPAFLMAAGLPLPRGIIAHGWLLFEEEKMSKSRGNVVRAEPIRRVLGSDALRYFLLREISFGQDGSFSYDSLVSRYNSDLANDWGNLASRTLNMIHRYFGGKIPYPAAGVAWLHGDLEIMRLAEQARDELRQAFDQHHFARGLESVWQLIAGLNRYLVDQEPWALAEKNDSGSRSRLATVLHIAAEGLRFIAVLLASVLPGSANRLWTQLGLEGDAAQRIDGLTWGKIPVDQAIAPIEPLFPRLEKAVAIEQLRRLETESEAAASSGQAAAGQSAAAASAPPADATAPTPAAVMDKAATAVPPAAASAPTANAPAAAAAGTQAAAGASGSAARIAIDDFAKVDMRVGEVKTAERIPGATKLLKLTVDIGTETRQIVAGIAEAYTPFDLVGKKVVIVANLEPRKLRGVESNGMIVAASDPATGKPTLVSVPAETPNGARLR